MIQCKITVDGTDYYISDQSKISNDGNFYHGFIKSKPSIKIGRVKGGYIAPIIGSITLINEPFNNKHPFSGSRYTALLTTPGPYTLTIGFNTAYPIFEGVINLTGLSKNQLNFSILNTNYTTELLTQVTEFSTSNKIFNPFSHGVVTDQKPIYKNSSRSNYHNPGLDHTETIAIKFINYGNASITSKSASGFNATVSDSAHFVGGGAAFSGKESLVSGTGKYGTTIKHFFDFVAGTNGLNLTTELSNSDKSEVATSRVLHIYENEQKLITELAGDVADYINHDFYIAPNPSNGNITLYLIDRAYIPVSSTILLNHEVIYFNLKLLIFGSVVGTYNIFRHFGNVTTADNSTSGQIWYEEAQELQEINKTVESINSSNGINKNIKVYADQFSQSEDQTSEVQVYLNAIRDIEKKPIVTIKVYGLKSDFKIGDRIKYFHEEEMINSDMLIRELTFNFAEETTTISGDATIEFLAMQA